MRCRFGRLPGAGLRAPSLRICFSAIFLRRVDFLDGFAAHRGNLLDRAQRSERGDGRSHHVDRIGRPQTLRENVVDAGQLEYGAHRSPGDNAGTGRGRLEQNRRGAEFVAYLVGNRSLDHRDGDEALTGLLDGFANRLGHFGRLADSEPDLAFAVADDDECAETETFAAFDDLRDAIDAHDRLFKAAVVAFATSVLHQKVNPASRAASASARTRPWYLYPPRSKTTWEMPAAFALLAIAEPTAWAAARFVLELNPVASDSSSVDAVASVCPFASSIRTA